MQPQYREALFRITGITDGKEGNGRYAYGTCYTEQEAREMGDKAACEGWMFIEVNVSRFIRELV